MSARSTAGCDRTSLPGEPRGRGCPHCPPGRCRARRCRYTGARADLARQRAHSSRRDRPAALSSRRRAIAPCGGSRGASATRSARAHRAAAGRGVRRQHDEPVPRRSTAWVPWATAPTRITSISTSISRSSARRCSRCSCSHPRSRRIEMLTPYVFTSVARCGPANNGVRRRGVAAISGRTVTTSSRM